MEILAEVLTVEEWDEFVEGIGRTLKYWYGKGRKK
jgi:hypothetical protein